MTLEFAEAAQMKDGLPRSAFAYSPTADPVTWKLPYLTSAGAPDPAHLPGAAAALSEGGFRGQTVDLPTSALPVVKAKLRQAYKRWGKTSDDMPGSIRENDTFAEATLDDVIEALTPVPEDGDIDLAIADRMRFAEAGDDHPYGAWGGGSKSGGGRSMPGGGGGKDIPEIPTEAQRKAMGKEALHEHYAKVDKLPDPQRRAYYDAEANAAVSGKLKPGGKTERAAALDKAGVSKNSPLRYEKQDRNTPLPQSPKGTAAKAAKDSAAAERAGLTPGTKGHTAYTQASATNQRAFSRGNPIKVENVKTKADRDLLIAQRRQKGQARGKSIRKGDAKVAQQRAAKDAAMARNTAARSNRTIDGKSGQKGFDLGHRGTGALANREKAASSLRTRLKRQGRSQSEIDAAVRVFRSNTR